MQIQGQFLTIGSVSLAVFVFINVILKHASLADDIWSPVFVLEISVIESPYFTAGFGVMKTRLIGNPGDFQMGITGYAGVASHAKIRGFQNPNVYVKNAKHVAIAKTCATWNGV